MRTVQPGRVSAGVLPAAGLEFQKAMLKIRPITLKNANAYVAQNHRHNQPTTGHKWSLACYDGDRLCGVAIAGNPVARKLDDGLTIEVRRVCTDGTRNVCSALYGACARVAKEMGYRKIITYTLISEPGTSLRASGWTSCGEAGGGILEYAIPPKGSRTNHDVRDGQKISRRKENPMGEGVL